MGIMITASHNPKIFNGYKVYNSDGYQIVGETADAIWTEIESVDYFDESDDVLKVARLIRRRMNAGMDDPEQILKIKLFIITNKESLPKLKKKCFKGGIFMQRMDNNELLSTTGGGIFTTIANVVIGIISLAKAIFSFKNLRG